MSKKRSPPPPPERRARWPLVAVGAATASAVVAAFFLGRGDDAPIVFPPPPALASAPGPTVDDFVGAEVCRDCHVQQYETWTASTHGRAGGVPSAGNLIASFDGRPIRFRDAVVIPSASGGEYRFTVIQAIGDTTVFRVDGVVGGGHMVGGGTQGFLSSFPDGTLRFLPFDFIRREGEWFCNTNTRTDEGWVPITREMALTDCGDWPPIRVFGTEERYANCQGCHGSQVMIRFDGAAQRYATHVRSLAINCESCHGPARDHVARARAGALGDTTDLGVRALGLLDEDASLEVCFQCHALKNVLEREYLAGKDFEASYSVLGSLLGDEPFLPDGRVRLFAYQSNHLASDCYLNGTMNCVDCHAPHGLSYRDAFGRPLDGRFDDGQCTACHASKAQNPTAHTRHPAESEGARCVSCHMPYLQHKEVGNQLRFARSDHTIPIPRPAFDASIGIETACAGCHRNVGIDSLQRITDAWYGPVKPHKDIVAGLIRAERGETADPVAELLFPDTEHPMAQVAALNVLMTRHLRPDAEVVDPEMRIRLERLALHENVDVESAALAALHLAGGNDPAVRRFLRDRIASWGERDRAMRRRWTMALGIIADGFREGGAYNDAVATYHKALELDPAEPRILRNLAQAHSEAGDYIAAIEFFERSLAADPAQALTLVNLGIALERAGRPDEAETAYRRAIEVNPTEALAHLNLGSVHLRREEFDEAITRYRRAVALDPGLALGHYYLARSLIMVNQFPQALVSVRRALQFDQSIEGAHAMEAELARVLGGGGR